VPSGKRSANPSYYKQHSALRKTSVQTWELDTPEIDSSFRVLEKQQDTHPAQQILTVYDFFGIRNNFRQGKITNSYPSYNDECAQENSKQ